MTENGSAGEEARAEEGEVDFENEDALLEHFERITEARQTLPWSERTRREKISYYMDRVFLGFLCVMLLVFAGEALYKTWYVTNVKAIYKFVAEIVTYLLTQEEKEELIEL